MALALSLGARGQGRTWPNPSVGCVIVKDGRILGRGWTGPGGRPHAEVVALEQAGGAACGATAYISLEPCAHHGKTPPCAEALIAAGIVRVVTALTDPDPRVCDAGHAMLRAAGIAVTTGVLEAEARAAHRGFLLSRTAGRPAVTLKLAASFDGRIATASGESRWVTAPEARKMVHALRARHDAVMVGGGTARADDPLLTVRGLGIRHQPVRVICARRLDLPAEGHLAGSLDSAPLWLCHGSSAPGAACEFWRERGARLLPVATGGDGQLDPAEILQTLGQAGLTRVFCEGGGVFAAALLSAGLVDDLVGFTAGVVFGAEGHPSLGAMGVTSLCKAPRFRLVDVHALGPDILHVWTRD
ncbi:diaminohydroxyphosphoribosylaminopyrimidine deaminase [Rhodovulum imhoffii]|uniref:Riboflavin biosynthesis protein RibD n=2 Tax=Rhodovulum imhoffii TaxID=365340 RepID=A0A2T5BVV4_9RHOB|nr:riboflavin biosynthesis protein RibD [Rhodovulum imhoffii]PTN03702.1 diaminohydroxyphosphoribosylaminopyrimidine deaminase [Rhodovulum imhoffii]